MEDDHDLELEEPEEPLVEELELDLRLVDFRPKDITSLVSGQSKGRSLQSHTSLSKLGHTPGWRNSAGLRGDGLGGYDEVLSGLFQRAEVVLDEMYGTSSRVVIAGP